MKKLLLLKEMHNTEIANVSGGMLSGVGRLLGKIANGNDFSIVQCTYESSATLSKEQLLAALTHHSTNPVECCSWACAQPGAVSWRWMRIAGLLNSGGKAGPCDGWCGHVATGDF